ncbi:DUF6531 domain-containing protein [Streptomyces litchfieldiae]|uniref:DUF6531 domain-containing protein n=1 Tax=Streptomyces litchfieldiae TaxID=3075543 RepID=A0ABU2MU94_9ACTN|nr:DUF6531 domain-containing protein [Streptomyces sp. DSM 44938]MDT0345120.1 DUF6531 domain-containing protein [Streptomyces sp. DSM 44938]
MDSDPAPGNPEEIRELAEELQEFADDVGEALGKIRGMASDRAVADWSGLSADAFRTEFDGVPENLTKLQTSYDMAADALARYWPRLENAQGMADRALESALAAQDDLRAAQSELGDAQDWVSRAGEEAERLQDEGESSSAEPPDEQAVRDAVRDHQAAEAAAGAAQSRVDAAEQRLAAARELAGQARELREEAARECARDIDAASYAGIQNRSWWEDAVNWVTENWDTFVDVCKLVVAVLGIVVMIIGGPLAWVVLAAALVVLTDTLVKYAQGRASLFDVAFAALDCIPGMKGLTTLGGLARGMRSLGTMGLRGMANGLRGLATRGRTMLADGMQAARSRFRTLIRSNGSDPIDMATGTMFLPQTDVTLPGVLPLAFTRRVESGYRAGWWFGPSWSSTCDQRLEVDDEGLVLVTEDGMLLAYPHPPARESQVLPETGPRWPLSRMDDDGYVVGDPQSGHARRFSAPRPDGVALLLEISDRNGNRIHFDYDVDGTPLAIRHSCGYHLKLITDGGRITALRLANAGAGGADVTIREYRYSAGNLAEVINSANGALRFTYDERLRVSSWTDSNDRRYEYSYDAEDRCVAEGGAAGHISLTLAYDGTDAAWPGMRVTTVTTAEEAVSRFVMNDLWQVVAEIDALGNVKCTEYDEHHHVVAWTDAEGNRTEVARDAEGRLVSVTRADGSVTRYSHDDLTRRTSATFPDGTTSLREYDAHGNCTAITDAAGSTTRYTFDEVGGLASVTDALGATTRVHCDAAGLPVEVSDPLGNRVTRRHDAFGRVTEVTSALGATTRLWWTVDGQLARVVGPDGAEQSWAYDGEGNRVRHVDEHGGVTEYEYTHFDMLAAQIGPNGVRHEFTYDASLRLTSVTNPQGLSWVYEYDAAGRLIGETDFDGRRVTYRRDALGRVVERTNPMGQSVTYEFDDLGLIRAKSVDGAVTTYEHDCSGRMLRASGPYSEICWERDAAGRVVSETVDGHRLSFRYDAVGQRTERVTPSGARALYSYDDAGRPVSIDTSGHMLSFTHDAAGQEISRQVSGSLTVVQNWDLVGRLTEMTVLEAHAGTPVQHRAYTYREDGNLLGVDDLSRGRSRFGLDGGAMLMTCGSAPRGACEGRTFPSE